MPRIWLVLFGLLLLAACASAENLRKANTGIDLNPPSFSGGGAGY
jgi:hypothetical protein